LPLDPPVPVPAQNQLCLQVVAALQTLVTWLLLLSTVLACEPLYDPQDFDRERALLFRRSALVPAPTPAAVPQLKVMAWNVKYGAGRIPFWFDCWGDRVQMSKAEVTANLQALTDLIAEYDPDILITEEIELNSRRSAYLDQVRFLLENTNLNYAAYVESWDSQYVASEGLGRVNMGNAIFSRYPIVQAERIRQADRTDQDALTAAFYLKRAVGRAVVAVTPTQQLAVYAVHTEAYDNDGTKQKQIKQIQELLSTETLPWLAGGDWNELPPVALRLQDFPDERTTAVCSADFVQPPYTPEILQPYFDQFLPYLPLSAYGTTQTEQARYFTHSVLGPDDRNEQGEAGDWNRTLDYLFAGAGGSWVDGNSDVLQRPGQAIGNPQGPVLKADPLRLSDHAPIVGLWQFPGGAP
jgi:endonuclease/exonuclease/phosphatase family metal-dependent hydrolase